MTIRTHRPGGVGPSLLAIQLLTGESRAWVSKGACLGAPPDLFFPPVGASVRKARTLCAACPVLEECRDYAARTKPPLGMWGGTTPRERRGMLPGCVRTGATTVPANHSEQRAAATFAASPTGDTQPSAAATGSRWRD
jgi:WhiB family redox-sensing transcriptional regulator